MLLRKLSISKHIIIRFTFHALPMLCNKKCNLKTIEIELRRDRMIYKVLYQELPNEVPVRERAASLYYEAKSERQVREELATRNLNIEFIQPLNDAHLDYEKQSSQFKVENV